MPNSDDVVAKLGAEAVDFEEGEGVELNDFYAHLEQHVYIFAPTGKLWPMASINGYFRPIKIGVDRNGKPVTIKASIWLDQNRPVVQMTWAPGKPMVIRDQLILEGGWVERNDVHVFNRYRPPPLRRPGDHTKAGRWLDHIEKIYPDDAAHIVNWFAHRVQHPEVKLNHALVLGGDQGIGKDTIIEPVKRAVGAWNCYEVGPEDLMGPFNDFAQSVILRISEVHDLGDVDRYTFYERLKRYTAAPPDVIRINPKHIHPFSAPNCCGVVITTNHKTFHLPPGDRRHYVTWSLLKMADFDEAYWNEMWTWYNEGGDRDVAAYLRWLDLSKFDPKAAPFRTEAYWNIVNTGRAPEETELADIMEAINNPDVVTLVDLVATAEERNYHDFANWLGERKNRRTIPGRLERCGYMPVRNPDNKDGIWTLPHKWKQAIIERRAMVYGKTELSYAEQVVAVRKYIVETRQQLVNLLEKEAMFEASPPPGEQC